MQESAAATLRGRATAPWGSLWKLSPGHHADRLEVPGQGRAAPCWTPAAGLPWAHRFRRQLPCSRRRCMRTSLDSVDLAPSTAETERAALDPWVALAQGTKLEPGSDDVVPKAPILRQFGRALHASTRGVSGQDRRGGIPLVGPPGVMICPRAEARLRRSLHRLRSFPDSRG